MAIKTAKFEVAKFGDGNPRSKQWLGISSCCKEMVNIIWRKWMLWHENNGSNEKLRAFMQEWAEVACENKERAKAIREWDRQCAAIRKSHRGNGKPKLPKKPQSKLPKPKNPVYFMLPELQREIRRALLDTYPTVHGRIVELLLKKESKLIKSKPSACGGAWPAWMMILTYQQSAPSYANPIPIPFDKACSKVLAPRADDEDYILHIRVESYQVEGKSVRDSVTDAVSLKSSGRKFWKQRRIIERICSGEYAAKGASLFWDKGTRKWYAHLGYEIPDKEPISVDIEAVAYLHAGKKNPWKLRYNGRSWFRGGRGYDIAGMRKKVFGERAELREHYRMSAHAAKGHGRGRAIRPAKRLEDRWRNFSKRRNNELSRSIIRELVENGIGRLVYIQPAGRAKASRFLCTAGATRHSSDWPHDQLGSMLSQKGTHEGIKVEIVKSLCERRDVAAKTLAMMQTVES